ncbi:MAG: CRISPR-associated endonuclease Cas1, partial [Methanocorpusculum sp.]|nr:CRISPR-associated endonuclease Cas1 [Methanocorpusculum sp.]
MPAGAGEQNYRGRRAVNIPWVTVWGFGAEVKVFGNSLFVREKGERDAVRYPLDEVSHLLIAGDALLHTSVVGACAKHGIAVSFFDVHGKPLGSLFGNRQAVLSSAQDDVPVHSFALASIAASVDARLRFLHELAEKRENFFYQGELAILDGARSGLEYLITLPELGRVFMLTRNMYYEILSRAVPAELGYRRRADSPAPDPVNALFSFGYSVLYATAALACTGAGLDLTKGNLYGKVMPAAAGRGGCVLDIIEPALVPMVDKVVISMAESGLSDECAGTGRCVLSEEIRRAFLGRLSDSVSREAIEGNVQEYADAVKNSTAFRYHYPL